MIIIILSFALGLIFGSFANVYFYRWPREESVVHPRSACPGCKNIILWFDNIPVLSFLILKGRCRSCGCSISVQYPLVELFCAFLFAAAAWKFHEYGPVGTGTVLVFSFLSVLAGGTDLTTYFMLERKYGLIPDEITAMIAVLGLVLIPWNPMRTGEIWQMPVDAIIVGGVLILFRALMSWVLKREALGWGDVKFLAAAALWLGWRGTTHALLIGSLLGSAVTLSLLAAKKIQRDSAVPFGPFLAFGCISALFF